MSDNIYGDKVGGGKYEGDQVAGDKYVFMGGQPAENEPYLEAALAQLAQLPTTTVPIPNPGPLPPNSRMPYSANPKFTGREGDM